MADANDIIVEEAATVPAEAAAEAPDAPATKPGRKKLVLIVAAALLLLGGGGGGAAYLLLGSGSEPGETHAAEEAGHGEDVATTFVDVPAMVVNLRSPDGNARFLKLHFVLVPGKKDAEELTAQIPLLLDAYQPFLRELRPEDLAGSAAVFRVKEEMLRRTAERIGPGAVKDILIQDLIQQ